MAISTRNALAAATGLLPTVATASAGAQARDQLVKICVLNDMADPYADITGQSSVIAMQMAVGDSGGKDLVRPRCVGNGQLRRNLSARPAPDI